MRVAVNVDRCEGHGMCEAMAPGIFELDDDGVLVNHYDGRDLDGELAAVVQRAIGACPVAAIQAEEVK